MQGLFFFAHISTPVVDESPNKIMEVGCMIKQPMQCYIESNINDETVKDKAGNDLLMIQNILADIGNGNQYCDDWNSEWEQMHPEYIGEDLNPGTEIGCKYGTI